DVKSVTRRQMVRQNTVYTLGELATRGQSVVLHMPSEIKAGFELSAGRMPQADHEVILGYHFSESLAKPGVEESSPSSPSEGAAGKPEVLNQKLDMEVVQFINKVEQKKVISLTVVGITKAPTREWMKDRSVYISEPVLKQIEEFTQTDKGQISFPDQPPIEKIQPDRAKVYNEVHVYANDVEDVKAIDK